MRTAILLPLVAVLFAVQVSKSPAGDAVKFSGEAIQGGLLIGKTEPGAEVSVNGKSTAVSEDGFFLIGFGRDAGPVQEATIELANGERVTRQFEIKKREYKISRVDGLPKRKVSPKPEDVVRIRADNAKIGAVRRRVSPEIGFLSGFMWPAKGRVSGVFGSQRILNGKPRRPHNGVDIAAPKGTSIVAAADGKVALVDERMFLTGKTVMLDHGLGLTSVYIHMSEIAVKPGQVVRQGDRIGAIGMTGRATGPHVHWGVSLYRTHLDPMVLVEGRSTVARTD